MMKRDRLSDNNTHRSCTDRSHKRTVGSSPTRGKRKAGRTSSRSERTGRSSFFSFAAAFLLIALLVVGPFSGLFRPESSEVNANQHLSEIQYKVVQIQQGDSLWTIAKNNMNPGFSDIRQYIREIKSCNQLEDDSITAGKYLMIPYYTVLPTDDVASAAQ